MKKSAILLLAISLVAGCGKSKQLVSPLDPPAGTQSESEPQSEEEKKEEKKADYMWYVRAAGYTAIAAGMTYLIYYVFDMCHKEYIPPQQNEEINQQEDDVSDEYSDSVPMQCANRGEGLNYVVCNGVLSQVAANNGMTYWGYEDVRPSPGKSIRVVSASGDHVISGNKVDAYMQKFENGELGPKPLTND